MRCPVCQLPGLSPPLLYGHYSLCHVTEPGPDGTCPLCPQVCRAGHGFTPFARHLEDCHAPDGLDENQDGHVSAEELRNSMKKMVNTKAAKKNLEEMFRASAVTIGPEKYAAYAWLVVRRPSDGKYLMVLESALRGLPRQAAILVTCGEMRSRGDPRRSCRSIMRRGHACQCEAHGRSQTNVGTLSQEIARVIIIRGTGR